MSRADWDVKKSSFFKHRVCNASYDAHQLTPLSHSGHAVAGQQDHTAHTAQYVAYKVNLECCPRFKSLLCFISHDSSPQQPIPSAMACQETSFSNIIFIKLGLLVTEVWIFLYRNTMFLLIYCDSYKTTEEHAVSLDKRRTKDTVAVMCQLREWL